MVRDLALHVPHLEYLRRGGDMTHTEQRPTMILEDPVGLGEEVPTHHVDDAEYWTVDFRGSGYRCRCPESDEIRVMLLVRDGDHLRPGPGP